MSYSFETATLTHTGKVRKVNEDSLYANAKSGVWVVADGMGGHRDGNIASNKITEAARKMAEQGEPNSRLAVHLSEINRELMLISNGDESRLVGSTVTALLANGGSYSCVWAGDSRCYLVRGGQIQQLSRDHTEVQEFVNNGLISAEEARNWHRRNVITRAVGADITLNLDEMQGNFADGDCFVLCSDGLTGHVTDAEILSTVTWAAPQPACAGLVDLALERGGRDNVSVIVIQVTLSSNTVITQKG